MTFFWIIVIIVVVWWLASHSKKTVVVSVPNNKDDEKAKTEITEEMVFSTQTIFDKKLNDEIDFPDAIRGVRIYIYRNLMCHWYDKLASENRYNEDITQKLRNDWLDYMWAVEHGSTYTYLSSEFWDEKDNTKSDYYRDKDILASKKMFAIEEAFAMAVGKKEVEELALVRKMDFYKFDKFGNLAPEGFEYDFLDELKPIKGYKKVKNKIKNNN